MKKYSILLGVLLILLTLCACSTNFSVTGEWVATAYQLQKPDNTTTPIEQYWTFGEDDNGTKVTKGMADGKEVTLEFTYTIEEQEITITFADALEPEQKYMISGKKDTLYLTAGSHKITLKKSENR